MKSETIEKMIAELEVELQGHKAKKDQAPFEQYKEGYCRGQLDTLRIVQLSSKTL